MCLNTRSNVGVHVHTPDVNTCTCTYRRANNAVTQVVHHFSASSVLQVMSLAALAPVVGEEFPSEVAGAPYSVPSAEVCVEGQGESPIAAAQEMESTPAELACVVM